MKQLRDADLRLEAHAMMIEQNSSVPWSVTLVASWLKPLIASFADEIVIVQMRVCIVNPVDLLSLPWTKGLIGIQAPDAFQQPLASQDFMQAGDAACKVMRRVVESRVAIGDLATPLNEAFRNVHLIASRGVTLLQQLRGTSRPHSPVTEQTAHDAALFR